MNDDAFCIIESGYSTMIGAKSADHYFDTYRILTPSSLDGSR